VTRLRDAAQRIAKGDLNVRVGPAMGSRQDETAQLARDFDHMTDRVRSLLEDQQRLLRDISHELRSPLARLNVALELARSKAGAKAEGELERIEREAVRLNDLIGELLTLTQLEQRGSELPRAPVDMAAVVEAVVRDADFEARARGRAVALTKRLPITLSGSAELLRRAVENVVRNAVRFTAPGTTVEVTLTRCDGNSPRVCVQVRDHGPGVPGEALEELFRPFYRVDAARDRDRGGSGLGLAIAAQATHIHGGDIRAENAEDGGLRVTIRLPDPNVTSPA
jgi:two-component system sensor histidine kinase CpxA